MCERDLNALIREAENTVREMGERIDVKNAEIIEAVIRDLKTICKDEGKLAIEEKPDDKGRRIKQRILSLDETIAKEVNSALSPCSGEKQPINEEAIGRVMLTILREHLTPILEDHGCVRPASCFAPFSLKDANFWNEQSELSEGPSLTVDEVDQKCARGLVTDSIRQHLDNYDDLKVRFTKSEKRLNNLRTEKGLNDLDLEDQNRKQKRDQRWDRL